MLKSFLGMVTFYLKFIPKSAEILQPLYRLLRKDVPWKWTDQCEKAVSKVKEVLTSKPVLAHFDPELPVKVTVEASAKAVGVVLSHVYSDGTERPVAFAPRRLSDTESRYPQIEREALSIIFGVTKFHDFLFCKRFTLLSDHKPLVYIFSEKKREFQFFQLIGYKDGVLY